MKLNFGFIQTGSLYLKKVVSKISSFEPFIGMVSLWTKQKIQLYYLIQSYYSYSTVQSEFIMIDFKGIVHPKMKILSLFTDPQVVPNLYVFICSAEHKGRRIGSIWKYLEECFNQTDLNPH